MQNFKKGITYGWLHKDGDSICLDQHSEEYAKKLDGGWSKERGKCGNSEKKENSNTNEEKKELQQESIDFDSMTNSEIRELAVEKGIQFAPNAKMENLITKIKERL